MTYQDLLVNMSNLLIHRHANNLVNLLKALIMLTMQVLIVLVNLIGKSLNPQNYHPNLDQANFITIDIGMREV